MIFDGPWGDVVMKLILVFGVIIVATSIAVFVMLTARMAGRWWYRSRLSKLQKRRGPFQKDLCKRWPRL